MIDTMLDTKRINEVAKRIALWILGGLLLGWIFSFEPMAAILAIISVDLFAVTPIAVFREKNAHSVEIIADLEAKIEQLVEIGSKNYDLAMSRKVSLEVAEENCQNLQRNLSELQATFSNFETKYKKIKSFCTNLDGQNKSLTNENESLKAANNSLQEKINSLTEKVDSLIEENESLKAAKKQLTNTCNAYKGVIKRQGIKDETINQPITTPETLFTGM